MIRFVITICLAVAGAFTLSLLRALDRKELAREGIIHFNALTYAVPDEVASLMKETGRSESEQGTMPATDGATTADADREGGKMKELVRAAPILKHIKNRYDVES